MESTEVTAGGTVRYVEVGGVGKGQRVTREMLRLLKERRVTHWGYTCGVTSWGVTSWGGYTWGLHMGVTHWGYKWGLQMGVIHWGLHILGTSLGCF